MDNNKSLFLAVFIEFGTLFTFKILFDSKILIDLKTLFITNLSNPPEPFKLMEIVAVVSVVTFFIIETIMQEETIK